MLQDIGHGKQFPAVCTYGSLHLQPDFGDLKSEELLSRPTSRSSPESRLIIHDVLLVERPHLFIWCLVEELDGTVCCRESSAL